MLDGGGGVAPEERVEALAVLSMDGDPQVAGRAAEALRACDAAEVIAALKREDPAEALFRYCAEHLAQMEGVADAMAANYACPAEQLLQVAPYLKETVNALVEDLDRISATPGLVTALAPSTHLGPRQKAAIEELLRDETPDETHVMRMLEGMVETVPEKKERLSLFQRVTKMKVSERMQLAIRGGREERALLIRDSSKLVQRAVLKSPRITEQEVESFAAMTSVSEDVLRGIAANRNFMKQYSVMRALTFNPKCPVDLSLGFMNRLLLTDLKHLTGNKNIPETLRTAAQKLFRQRTTKKDSSE